MIWVTLELQMNYLKFFLLWLVHKPFEIFGFARPFCMLLTSAVPHWYYFVLTFYRQLSSAVPYWYYFMYRISCRLAYLSPLLRLKHG